MVRVRGTFFLAAFAALLLAAPASGQNPAQIAKVPPAVRAKLQTDFMEHKLSLSSDQTSKVQAINVRFAEKMQPILDGSMGPFERMREGRKLEKEKEAELKGVLNEDQFQKFLAAKSEMKEKLKAKMMEKTPR